MRSHFLVESPIGTLTLVKTNGVLSGLYMGDARAELLGSRADSGFEDVVEQLEEYFARKRTMFTVPIAPRGTTFQQRVWTELTTIPYGETREYTKRVIKTMAAYAMLYGTGMDAELLRLPLKVKP